MATINIAQSSMIQYYNTGTAYQRYTGSYDGKNEVAAYIENMAQNNAYSNALNGGGGDSVSTPSGGSSSSSNKYFGSSFDRKYAGTPYTISSYLEGTHLWVTAECYGASDGTMYQLKLPFTLPSGVTSSLINSASITINCSGVSSSGKTFALYAPKTTTNQTNYQKPSDSSIIEKKFTFTVGNGSQTITKNNFTDAFKQCIDKGQGWVTLGCDSDAATLYYDTEVTVTSATITYTLKYTNCEPPTQINITDDIQIQKPGGSVNFFWSGDKPGNNMTISNYTIYWKVGDAPTTSSYTGSATSNSSSYNFTIPSGATRGSTYYFKIVTNGSISGYSSSISSAQATVKVNTLPGAPTVTVNKTRVPSGGGTVTFTVAAGTDSDSQTKTLYYATSATGSKTLFTSPYTTPTLTSARTYYFWTYDGLEYSSSYTSKSITVNIPPSISNFNMTAITTYSPSVQNRDYVKNIRIDTPTITKDPGATLSYSWKFLIGIATSDSDPSDIQRQFGTSASYTNLDVTIGGVGFNNSYRLQLTVTDDLGESATKNSNNIFCIPTVPTIVIYNQKANSNVSTANESHFGRYIRVKYSEENNGVDKELQYSTSSSFTSYNSKNLTGTINTDVDLNTLTHGTVYYFRLKYICNSATTYAIFNPMEGDHPNYISRTRSADITPQNITISPQSGTSITPYTDNLFTTVFTNQPLSFSNNLDVATNYSSIYNISLEYGGRSLNLSSNGTDASGTVTATCVLNDKATSNWITLINGSNSTSAPNNTYNVSLKIIAQNEFKEQFQNIITITLDFIEEIYNLGNVSLEIKTGNNSWKSIPSSYQNLTLENRYPTFETQTLRINYSNLKTRANQTATIYFMNGSSVLSYTTITDSEWTAPSTSGDYIYTLNGNKYVNYTLPVSNIAEVRNYSVRIVLANGKDGLITGSTTPANNLNTTSIHRFSPSLINFKINTVSEDSENQLFNTSWTCTDFGGSIQNTNYTNSYSTVAVQLQYSNTPTGTYIDIGNINTLPNVGTSSMSASGDLLGASTSGVLYDIVYFGIKLIVTLRFTQIDDETPTGTSIYTYYYKNQKVLYRATPNLLYGKNYFIMNATLPTSGITDQILELHETETRKSIYIGDLVKGVLTITNNGLTTDNFIINGGTWDSN